MPGKTVSPRLKEIEDNFVKNGGSFKGFRIGELFIGSNGDKDIQKQHVFPIKNNQDIPVISSGEYNLGVIGTTDLNAKIFPENTLTADMFGNVKFRDYPYKMVTHARVFSMKPLMPFNRCHGLFVQTHLSFLKKKFSYNNMCSWEKVKNEIITLPVHTDNHIAFDYMENFIRELEMERIRELDAYLEATGLNNTELTDEEKDCLEKFEKGEFCFKEFRIGELFEIHTGSLIPSQKLKKGSIPRISVMSSNNGMIDYYDTENCEEARHFSNFISVNFFGNCFYHPYKASLEMKVHVLHIPTHSYTDATGLYVTSALNRVLNGNYSYGEQLSSSDLKNQNIYISLPVYNDRIAFDAMETFIRALEKLCIRSVVTWKDKIIETTKRVVNANAPSDG